jgi:hypothetical protein
MITYKGYTIQRCTEQGRKALCQVVDSNGKIVFYGDWHRECKSFINAQIKAKAGA